MSRQQLTYLFGILAMVLFDALQQNYYLETFQLAENEIALYDLLISHLIRWSIWVVVSLTTYRVFKNSWKRMKIEKWASRAIQIFSTTVVSVLLISIMSIVKQAIPLTSQNFIEVFQFFTFQKALTFSSASVILFLHLDARDRNQQLRRIQTEFSDFREALKKEGTQHFIQVKVGFRVQNIDVKEIVWIQSDDYCSKVHTADQCFTVRKSLKSFGNELENHGFVRIHRGALLNLNYLDQIDLRKSLVRLKTKEEIPVSRMGIKVLKQEVA